ncbi:DUF2336 domain-containing protein [Prosthecomicrobium pneumaticum]|uniref:Uncharacterized protein (DUF2336 family) n=1 Tax=Prosthecomicrobium pneumaticum TaxID=81895 RepID=A0A7W9FLS3_9HYPH|nr:DUF2336 domain-containing protein [Prosthecomicrobium pneumaticum]MBB5752997.1 uncharacterized protein (DUF2336 family) [Prosthecomicrobium pneumaticum]
MQLADASAHAAWTRLASDRSEAGRAELLDRVTRLFLAGPPPSPVAAALYADVVLRLLAGLPAGRAAALAARLAEAPDLPVRLALHLAAQPIAVAAPLLRHSPVLGTADLARLAEAHGAPHRAAIAMRRDLDPALVEGLVEGGERTVLHALAANDAAPLSGRALAILLGRAEADGELRARLAARQDAPAEVAERLVPFLARQLRALRAMALRSPPAIPPTPWLSPEAVAEALRPHTEESRLRALSTLIATAIGLPAARVAELIGRRDPAPIAALCKVAGLPGDVFAALVGLSGAGARRPAREVERLARRYETLSLADAERGLALLGIRRPRARGTPTGP